MMKRSDGTPQESRLPRRAEIGFVLSVALWFWLADAGNVFREARGLWPIALALSVALSLPALVFVFRSRRRWAAAGYGGATLVALVLVVAPWHPRKRFLGDLAAVRPGMTRQQAQARMARYAPSGSIPPADGSTTYVWDLPGGAYDADIAEVRFSRGRVVGVAFMPD